MAQPIPRRYWCFNSILFTKIDFCGRFASLLGYAFQKFPVQTALQILAKRRERAEFVGTEKKEYYGHLQSMR